MRGTFKRVIGTTKLVVLNKEELSKGEKVTNEVEIFGGMPKEVNVWRRIRGETLSKALVMSRNTQTVNSFLRNPSLILLVRMERLSRQDFALLNPNWKSGKM